MKKTAFLGYLSFYSIVVSGQTNTEAIKGNVKDEKKQPIEFVNVLLLNAIDSSLVKDQSQIKKVILKFSIFRQENIGLNAVKLDF